MSIGRRTNKTPDSSANGITDKPPYRGADGISDTRSHSTPDSRPNPCVDTTRTSRWYRSYVQR